VVHNIMSFRIFAESLLDVLVDPPGETTKINVRQKIYRIGIHTWQTAKKGLPFLNNYSHLVGRIAFSLFPPDKKEVRAEVPWNFWASREKGYIILPPNSPSSRTYLSKRYELEVVDKMIEMPLGINGTTAIDVGAHAGYYTKLMSERVGPTGLVYAFEPNPISFKYLQRNMKRTLSMQGSIFPSQVAIGEKSGEGFLEDIEDLEHGQVKSSGTFEIKVKTLDELFAERTTRIGLIKIDTEGHEVNVIKGARQLLANHPEVALIIEHQSLRENDAYEMLSWILYVRGFTKYQVIERGTWHHIRDPFPYPTHNIVYNLYFPARDGKE